MHQNPTKEDTDKERDERHIRKRKDPWFTKVDRFSGTTPYRLDILTKIAEYGEEGFGKYTLTATTAELEKYGYPYPFDRITAQIVPEFVELLFVTNPGAAQIYRYMVEWHKEFFELNGLPPVDYTAIELPKNIKAQVIAALL